MNHDSIETTSESGALREDTPQLPAEQVNRKASALQTKIYLLENLGCANCAAKMEQQINALDAVSQATVTYATKQLKIVAPVPDALLEQIRQICAAIEPDVKVVMRNSQGKASVLAAQKKRQTSAAARSLAEIICGAALFIFAQFFEFLPPSGTTMVFVLAYLILGGRIVATAVKNLSKGQVFDENFLMSLATLGAFAIREYPEAVGVMLFYRVGEFFEHKAVEKSRGQIMDAVDLRPEVVNLLEGETVKVIDAEEAKVGDLLLVRPGDRIPLDGVITDGESRVDTSAITGEPVPVKVMPGNAVISGGVNLSGALKIRVQKVLAESMVTRILDSVENAAASKPKIDRFITRFARVYTPFVVAVAALVAVVPSLATGNWEYWIYTALTFLVISCPCALVLSVPLAFFSGIGAGSKRGILFKGGASLEAISDVKAVVMDKTGTITQGKFALQKIAPINGINADALLALCASAESSSTHPIAVSIVEAAKTKNISLERPLAVEEEAGKGIRATLLPGVVLCGNRALLEAHDVTIEENQSTSFGTEVFVALSGRFIGSLVIADALKTDAPDAIAALKRLGIATAMLTGDAKDSAESVAKQAGIEDVRARLLPQDKLTEMQNLRARYGSVMFVGDGINDAPVLAGADVGAAMGSGADAAIEAADVVFMTSRMEAVPQSIAIARRANRIARQNVAVSLVTKAVVMTLGIIGHASMWMAVFADTGVAMLCVLNSVRILYKK